MAKGESKLGGGGPVALPEADKAITRIEVEMTLHPRGLSKATRAEIGKQIDSKTEIGDEVFVKEGISWTKEGKNTWRYAGSDNVIDSSKMVNGIEGMLQFGNEVHVRRPKKA